MDQLYRLGLLNNGKDKLYTAQSTIHSTGLFTSIALPKGTLICRIMELGPDLESEIIKNEPFKWVNHAIVPNARITDEHALISVRAIQAEEEICIDYHSLPVSLVKQVPNCPNPGHQQQPSYASNPFQSFWMGGFECTDQLNNKGSRVDMLGITRHIELLDQDYELLKAFDIRTVREGIRWSKVEKQPYQYDFSTVKQMLDAGKRQGMQQLWDICHFGFPDDLSPLHPQFTDRFVSICRAFAEFHRQHYSDQVLIVTPINEVSFLSWLGGEAAGTVPYCRHNGWEVKYHLMKAYIAGIRALKAVNPDILIVTTEPLVNIVPPVNGTAEKLEKAQVLHLEQYQAMDILTGTLCPELGGAPDLVDFLGFNFYYNNQWSMDFDHFLPWLNEEPDPRWRPLHSLLEEAFNRYHKPILLSETSHSGEDRYNWIKFVTEQCRILLEKDIPFYGICLYPIIDRPDWDELTNWHHSGLWDHVDERSCRVLDIPYAESLRTAQRLTKLNQVSSQLPKR